MRKCTLLNLLLGFLFPFVALAQTTDIDVSVRELTRQQPVSGITVYLDNIAIGENRQAVTDRNGQVRFGAVPLNGTYRVFTKADSTYLESEANNLVLRANAQQSVTLQLPSRRELTLREVQVRSRNTTQINTINAEVSSQLSIRKVEELPLEGRDIMRVLSRLPNVSQATGFYAEAPVISINSAGYNSYLIDGMDNNERFLGQQKFAVPVGFTRNVSVLTSNYSVEFGNTNNGVVNITSKSGSNQTTGEVFFLNRPGAVIDAQTSYPLRDLSGNQVKDGFQRYQGGFGLGGAIVKNKTFYYLNAEHTTDIKDNLLLSPQLGVNETARGTNRFTFLSGKLDQFWTDRFKSSLRVNLGQITIGRQAGGLSGGTTFPSAAAFQDRNSLIVASRNTYNTERFASETNILYSRFRWNYARALNEGNPTVQIRDPNDQTIAVIGRPTNGVFDSRENTMQFQQKFSFYRGNHTIRAGAEFISSNFKLAGGANPNGNYTVRLTAAQLASIRERNLGSNLSITDIPTNAQVVAYTVELRPTDFGKTQNIVTGYVEDQWAASPRLNLTLGLRYDYDNLSVGGSTSGDVNNIAPRFSFNYKLGDGRSAIRGGTGLFYDKILYSIYSDALQQNTTGADFKREVQYLVDRGILPASTDVNRVTFDGNLPVGSTSNTGLPFGYLQGPSASSFANNRNVFINERRILNPSGYQNPYAFQSTLGYQYQVNDKLLIYADIVYNEQGNLFRTTNLNAPSTYDYGISAQNNTARSTQAADLTRPLPIYGGYTVIGRDTLRGVARSVVMTETKGRGRYMAFSFNIQRDRAADNFAYRLVYTLSRYYNNTDGINFRAQDNNNYAAEWGPGVNDRTHIINGIVNYYLGQRFLITAAALIQSGQPINRIPEGGKYAVVNAQGQFVLNNSGQRIFTTDLNGDGGSFADAYTGNSDRYPGASRNSDRLPWSKVVDLSLQYTYPISARTGQRIEFRADVFNALNTNNLSGYANNALQSNQIQAGPSGLVQRNAGPPRQFQFGARYLF